MKIKVISGGQTGVDQAALAAATFVGFETGGWMPKGWLTQGGPRPEFNGRYGMREHSSPKYSPRTFANVRDSHMTLRIAVDFHSPGERIRLKAIRQYRQPHMDIQLVVGKGGGLTVLDESVLQFAAKQIMFRAFGSGHNPFVLNVAGNAERRCLGIQNYAEKILVAVFTRMRELKGGRQ